MSGANLWNFLFNNFFVYVIGCYVFFKMLRGIGSGSLGDMLIGIVIGSVAYWFGKDPGGSLQTLATIWDKIKDTGAGGA